MLHCSSPQPRRGLARRKLRGPRPELNRRGFQEVSHKWPIQWYDFSHKQKEVVAIISMTAATSLKATCKEASMIQGPFQSLSFADPTSDIQCHPLGTLNLKNPKNEGSRQVPQTRNALTLTQRECRGNCAEGGHRPSITFAFMFRPTGQSSTTVQRHICLQVCAVWLLPAATDVPSAHPAIHPSSHPSIQPSIQRSTLASISPSVHPSMRSSIYACIETRAHACTHAYVLTCMPAYLRSCIQTSIHPSINTY